MNFRKHFRFASVCVLTLLPVAATFAASQKYDATGLLLQFDDSHRNITVSCRAIPGYMDAMVMSLPVRGGKLPANLQPGSAIEFDLVVKKSGSYAENVRVKQFASLELDPAQARRLRLMEGAIDAKTSADAAVHIGQPVPDFRLTDQNHQPVSLAQFKGKVVALTFIYTRCPLPDYCIRLTNNFGILQRRFRSRMGEDLILLTVVIDPIHDQPDILKSYARTWKADSRNWHFLTGSSADIQQLCQRFDMAFYPDEALYVHSFHTVVIDRKGELAANLEGNEFTAKQLGDLTQTVMERSQ
jgi:protein SCO1/2